MLYKKHFLNECPHSEGVTFTSIVKFETSVSDKKLPVAQSGHTTAYTRRKDLSHLCLSVSGDKKFRFESHEAEVKVVAFDPRPGSYFLASASDSDLYIFDTRNPSNPVVLAKYRGHFEQLSWVNVCDGTQSRLIVVQKTPTTTTAAGRYSIGMIDVTSVVRRGPPAAGATSPLRDIVEYPAEFCPVEPHLASAAVVNDSLCVVAATGEHTVSGRWAQGGTFEISTPRKVIGVVMLCNGLVAVGSAPGAVQFYDAVQHTTSTNGKPNMVLHAVTGTEMMPTQLVAMYGYVRSVVIFDDAKCVVTINTSRQPTYTYICSRLDKQITPGCTSIFTDTQDLYVIAAIENTVSTAPVAPSSRVVVLQDGPAASASGVVTTAAAAAAPVPPAAATTTTTTTAAPPYYYSPHQGPTPITTTPITTATTTTTTSNPLLRNTALPQANPLLTAAEEQARRDVGSAVGDIDNTLRTIQMELVSDMKQQQDKWVRELTQTALETLMDNIQHGRGFGNNNSNNGLSMEQELLRSMIRPLTRSIADNIIPAVVTAAVSAVSVDVNKLKSNRKGRKETLTRLLDDALKTSADKFLEAMEKSNENSYTDISTHAMKLSKEAREPVDKLMQQVQDLSHQLNAITNSGLIEEVKRLRQEVEQLRAAGRMGGAAAGAATTGGGYHSHHRDPTTTINAAVGLINAGEVQQGLSIALSAGLSQIIIGVLHQVDIAAMIEKSGVGTDVWAKLVILSCRAALEDPKETGIVLEVCELIVEHKELCSDAEVRETVHLLLDNNKVHMLTKQSSTIMKRLQVALKTK